MFHNSKFGMCLLPVATTAASASPRLHRNTIRLVKWQTFSLHFTSFHSIRSFVWFPLRLRVQNAFSTLFANQKHFWWMGFVVCYSAFGRYAITHTRLCITSIPNEMRTKVMVYFKNILWATFFLIMSTRLSERMKRKRKERDRSRENESWEAGVRKRKKKENSFSRKLIRCAGWKVLD